jgi:hypothetical protein
MQWTEEFDNKLRALREQGGTFSEIAMALNLWFDTNVFTKDGVQKRHQALSPPQVISLPTEPMPVWRRYFDEDGQALDSPMKNIPAMYGALGLARRFEILHISDLHVDQHDEGLLNRVLSRHCGADVVVLNGDFLDIYNYSRYDKLKNRPIERELEAGIRILEHLAYSFPVVVVTDSNHLFRVSRSVKIPEGLLFLFQHDLMARMAAPFSNVHVVDRGPAQSWWCQIGDALFTHADYARQYAPMSAVKINEYMSGMLGTRQFPDLQPYRVLVQAHTHQVGSTYVGGVKVIESGCLAKLPLEYASSAGAVKFPKPQTNGYAVVVQKSGRSLLNESREFFLGDELNAGSYVA